MCPGGLVARYDNSIRNSSEDAHMVHQFLHCGERVRVCEKAWRLSVSAKAKAKAKADIEEMMWYVLAEYCGDLRGEEVPLFSLKEILHFWNEALRHEPPDIMLTLHG
jgi:hypothetical protein